MFSACATCVGLATACLPLWLSCVAFAFMLGTTHSALLQRTQSPSQNVPLGCDSSRIAWLWSLQTDWMGKHRSTNGVDMPRLLTSHELLTAWAVCGSGLQSRLGPAPVGFVVPTQQCGLNCKHLPVHLPVHGLHISANHACPLNPLGQQPWPPSSECTRDASGPINGSNSYCRSCRCPYWLPTSWDRPRLKKCGVEVAWVSTMVCATDLGNMQLIMVLHTKGMFPVGMFPVVRSSFRKKVNFRPVVDKVADMCWLVCAAVQQQFILHITEVRQETLQLSFSGCFPGAILYFKLMISDGGSGWWLKLSLNLMLSLGYLLLEKPLYIV